MSEVKRSLIRIASNYGRLFSTLALGLYWVPLMLRCVQDEAFGLVAFLGTNAGLAFRIRHIVNRSIVRELGVAHHSDDPMDFVKTYNCAIVVALATSAITLLLQAALLYLLPFFSLPEGLLGAGRWFIVAKGIEIAYTIALAPAFNFYLIDERMPIYNFWLVALRSANVLGALLVLILYPLAAVDGVEEIAHNLTAYAWFSAAIAMIMLTIPVILLATRDRRFLPRLSLIDYRGIRAIASVGGWVAAMDLSISGFMAAAGFYMFGLFGPLGGRVFGVAMPLTFYVRMLATGMAAGLEAVSTRISSKESADSLERLVYHSTRLNAFVVFPAMIFIVIFAEKIVNAWVGTSLSDSRDVLAIAHAIHALALGAISIGIADAWINVMYGAGHIRRIAPVVIIGLVVYCVTTPIALWVMPKAWHYLIPMGYSSVVILASVFLGISVIVAGTLNVTLLLILSPLVKPLLLSIAALPVLLPNWIWIEDWSLFKLIAAALQYGSLYVILSWFFVLRSEERARFVRGIKARAWGRSSPSSDCRASS